LKDIVLNERSQAQKNKYHMFSTICGSYKADLKDIEIRIVVTRA
jgi:hypothetical protein